MYKKKWTMFFLFGLRPILCVFVCFFSEKALHVFSEKIANIAIEIPSIELNSALSPLPEYTQICMLSFFAISPLVFLDLSMCLWKAGNKDAITPKAAMISFAFIPMTLYFLVMGSPNPNSIGLNGLFYELAVMHPVLFLFVHSLGFSLLEISGALFVNFCIGKFRNIQ